MVKIKDSYYAYLPADKILKDVINTVENQISEILDDLDADKSEKENEREEEREEEEEEEEFLEQQNEFLVQQDGKLLFKKSLDETTEFLDDSECLNENDEMIETSGEVEKKRKSRLHKSELKLKRPIHSCTECSYTCGRAKFMRLHLLHEHNISNRKFKCPDCELSFDQNCILKAHYTRKHTNECPFTCSYCGKQYKVKGDLSNHVRLYHEEKSLVCDICGKSCSNSNSLYTHKKRLHYTPNYKCLLCKRSMVTQENLDRHMISQHSRFVCEECGKTFSTKVILHRHIQSVHNNIKLHACEFCSRCFSRQSHLRQHLLIHTGKRLFACDLCDKTFTQKPGLLSHRKLHPGDHPPLPTFRLDDVLSELMTK